jgi:hypothetical protein
MTPHPPPVFAPRRSATIVVLHFHSSKEKLGAGFTTLLFQIFFTFLKLRDLELRKLGSGCG